MKKPTFTKEQIEEFVRKDDAHAISTIEEDQEYTFITMAIDFIISNSFLPGPNITKMIENSLQRMMWSSLEIKKMLKECNVIFINYVLNLLGECKVITPNQLREEGYDPVKIEAYESFYKKNQISTQPVQPVQPAQSTQSNRTTIISVSAIPAGANLKNCNMSFGSITGVKYVVGK